MMALLTFAKIVISTFYLAAILKFRVYFIIFGILISLTLKNEVGKKKQKKRKNAKTQKLETFMLSFILGCL